MNIPMNIPYPIDTSTFSSVFVDKKSCAKGLEDAGAAPHAEAGPAGRTQRKIFSVIFRHTHIIPH